MRLDKGRMEEDPQEMEEMEDRLEDPVTRCACCVMRKAKKSRKVSEVLELKGFTQQNQPK